MAVGLQLAGKNDFARVQEDINDNLTKLDEAIDFNLLATLGIEYGGILNNTDAKVAGKAYYDTTGKKLYKCIVNTSINYADAGFFEALSNNDLNYEINQLKEFKTETLVILGGKVHFSKFGKIGIISFFNVTSTDSTIIFPSWFVVKNNLVLTGVLTSEENGIVGEVHTYDKYSLKIHTLGQTRRSLSGSVIAIME